MAKRTGYRKTHKRNDLIDSIIDMYVNKPMNRVEIMEYLQKELGLSRSYSAELFTDAKKVLSLIAADAYAQDKASDLERFEADRTRALRKGNDTLAHKILVEISKIKGHYVERVEINGINPEAMPDIIHIISGPEDNEE